MLKNPLPLSFPAAIGNRGIQLVNKQGVIAKMVDGLFVPYSGFDGIDILRQWPVFLPSLRDQVLDPELILQR